MRAMAKIEIIRWPVVGPILEKCGVFGVDRGNTDMKAARMAMKSLKEGSKLLMFPEGTRVKEGESVDAKAGAALFATRCNVPLLPVYINNSKKLFKRSTVVVGQPYMPEYEGRKASSEELQKIVQDLQDRIYALEEASR
jgi:1-acyl-sn-glycerol-3-phosphate acyltransferase